jgi:hypothetical protein
MPSVYIETTIPSYYHTHRTSVQALAWQEQTRVWWDKHRHLYELCTSIIVVEELGEAPPERAAPRLAMLHGLRNLTITTAVRHVVDEYLRHRLMPRVAEEDAYHVALASTNNIDYVLTWNCRHIANANKATHLHVLNTRLGLPVPKLVTPYDLATQV